MRDKILILGIALFSALLVSFSFRAGLFSGLENFFEDLLFSTKPIDPAVVMVVIDSDSITRIGQWPWPREVFSRAFWQLNKKPPRVVGFDVMLAEPSRHGEKDDSSLVSVLEKIVYPVVLPVEGAAGKLLKPLAVFTTPESVSLGHANLIIDKDGIVRRFPLNVANFEAISRVVVKKGDGNFFKENLFDDPVRIVYAATAGSIRRIPFWRLLEPDFNKGNLADELKDKIVLIGATAADLHDEHLTPFSRGQAMAGVEIQANLVNMLLSNYSLRPLDSWVMIGWLFLASISPAFIIFFLTGGSLRPIFSNVLLGISYTVLVVILFEKGIVANLLHVNFSWILSTLSLFGYKYFSGERERREVKRVFSKYVSGEVLKEILRDPKKVALGGEEKEVTVFFSDIRGFTTIAEKTTPRELVRILNKYFTVMNEEILRTGGVLDKYIGDAIMAFWGAPLADPEQADNALQTSLKMLAKLKDLNKELKERGDPEINIGIGVYTGLTVVGNIGSEARFDYTVIGDTVNVASRLEGLNKQYGTDIIVGESTKNKCRGDYRFKFIGSVEVKGRKEPLNIYTIL